MLLASLYSVLNKIFYLTPPLLIGAAVDTFVQHAPGGGDAARDPKLHPERASEPPGRIKRGSAIVIHKDMLVAAIGKDGAA